MQIIPFRLFLSWSIVIIFLKPILRIFEFYIRCINFKYFNRPKLPSLFVYETIPRFEIDFLFSKRPPRLSPRKPNNDFEIHYSKLKVISFPSPV